MDHEAVDDELERAGNSSSSASSEAEENDRGDAKQDLSEHIQMEDYVQHCKNAPSADLSSLSPVGVQSLLYNKTTRNILLLREGLEPIPLPGTAMLFEESLRALNRSPKAQQASPPRKKNLIVTSRLLLVVQESLHFNGCPGRI